MTAPHSEAMERGPIRCDLVMEQTLGHVTHTENLRRLLPADVLTARFLPVEFAPSERWARIPGHGNWTIRAGLRAKQAVRAAHREGAGAPDVMFVHTQVPAVLMRREMRAVPTVVSLDATPKQYDELGAHYSHEVGRPSVERLKTELNRRCFERAAHLVTWASWTKHSLIEDYGIEQDRITVIAPGVDHERWATPDGLLRDARAVRILFVGGNLERKGGHHLLAAFAELRSTHGDAVELHLVTPTPVTPAPGIFVYDSMTPNSPALIELYHRCQIFCLPTLGDCLPMVLPEAAAAGLAVVSTRVGAIPEIVRDGQTGLLVDTGEVDQLVSTLGRLVNDRELRERLAAAGSELVRQEHSAGKNAERLAEVLRDVATTGRKA